MYVTKVSLKIKKYQWHGLYNFLFKINQEVTEQLNSRHAHLEQSKYVLYDICQSQTTTQVYHRWQNRQADKYYTLHLPIGQAVTLCQYCFNVSIKENPDLHSFIGTLYMRLTEFVSGHQFSLPVPKNIHLKEKSDEI